jgi:hypothetical protein
MKLLKVIGFTCIAILAVLSLLWWGCDPHRPNDQSLELRFYKHRSDFERLVAMMDEDWKMSRIASDFTATQDNGAWPRPESEWGISRARWDEYRKIFDRTGLDGGTTRREKSSDVMVDVWSWGIVPAESAISYLHCGTPRNGYAPVEPPCTEKRDSGRGMYGPSTTFGYRYKKITEDWYIFEEFN